MLITAQAEDSTLLQALQLGNHAAFEILYNRYSKKLYWNLLRMIKDRDQAEEILQELFVKVWEKRTQISEEYSFQGYLRFVAKNMVTDYYRKLARMYKAEQELKLTNTEYSNSTEESVFSRETTVLLQSAINTLPEQRRIAFNLCKIEGKSHKEAAEIMGISPNTVHNHLVKATQTIKATLTPERLPNPALILTALAISFM